jgi:uncharacterized protein Yka (UPF0111/DUF47 family)
MKLTKEECLDALDYLYKLYEFEEGSQMPYGECIGIEYKEEFETLQQLINEHFELVDAFHKLGYESLKVENKCQNLVSEIDKLEKALDKACDELAKQNNYEYWNHSMPFNTKEEWKEHLLNEVD